MASSYRRASMRRSAFSPQNRVLVGLFLIPSSQHSRTSSSGAPDPDSAFIRTQRASSLPGSSSMALLPYLADSSQSSPQ